VWSTSAARCRRHYDSPGFYIPDGNSDCCPLATRLRPKRSPAALKRRKARSFIQEIPGEGSVGLQRKANHFSEVSRTAKKKKQQANPLLAVLNPDAFCIRQRCCEPR
jgi:hypothetical protein